MHQPRTLHSISSRFCRAVGLSVLLCAGAAAAAQEPLTLRQAIDQALGQSPEATVAGAGDREAKAAASLARTQLLPRLSFTEDVSRGDDPVYAFGMRLRQRQFTQDDFAQNALNRPQPIGNFATRFPVRGRCLTHSKPRGRFAAPISRKRASVVCRGGGPADRA